MTIAGIEVGDSRLIWAETEFPLAPLDHVILRLNGEETEGTVLIAPNQLLRPPPATAGTVARVLPQPIHEAACDALPGADLPPLGTDIRAGDIAGRVTALDPVVRTVTITPTNGGDAVMVPVERLDSA